MVIGFARSGRTKFLWLPFPPRFTNPTLAIRSLTFGGTSSFSACSCSGLFALVVLAQMSFKDSIKDCRIQDPPSCPPDLLRHARRTSFVRPAGPPLSGPPVSSVIPAGPPLSFPPVVSGNPVSCSSIPSFGWSCMGKSHGFPIKNVGNDMGESCVHAGVKGGSGPLPEDFDVMTLWVVSCRSTHET